MCACNGAGLIPMSTMHFNKTQILLRVSVGMAYFWDLRVFYRLQGTHTGLGYAANVKNVFCCNADAPSSVPMACLLLVVLHVSSPRFARTKSLARGGRCKRPSCLSLITASSS